MAPVCSLGPRLPAGRHCLHASRQSQSPVIAARLAVHRGSLRAGFSPVNAPTSSPPPSRLWQTVSDSALPVWTRGRASPDWDNSIRCNSGRHVSTSDSTDDSTNSKDTNKHTPSAHAHERSTSWSRMVLALPLELAVLQSHTDNFYLRKRKRKHWWSREHFPKVPADNLQEYELPEPAISIWQKLLPLGLIFFCASFNLTILQNLKDAIIVTTAGAETLPFLASFCVLPASLAFFMIYGQMVEHLHPNAVFYAAVAPLVLFYAVFATVLFPAASVLHPHGMYNSLARHVPLGLHGLLKVIENWTFSLFFCIAELWGSVVISVLFWSLANEVCDVKEAKTIYPLMGISANFALVVAGNYMKFVNTNWTQGSMLLSLRFLVGTVVAMTAVMLTAKGWVDSSIKKPEEAKPPKKKKKKGSLGESFAVLKSSPKILSLAMLVMSYGVSHRLFEFAWKGQLRVLFPSAQAYQGVLADVSIATGSVTIGLMLTGRFVFQYLGWGAAAIATPVVMALSGAAFFGMSLAAQFGLATQVGPYSLAAAGVMAGAVTQVFARSAKFSLFDPAKEMVYIEMSKEEKSKGKAAVDLLGSQIGKSGASWVTQALLLCLGSIQRSMPIIAATFLAVITAWITSVRLLNRQLQEADAQLTGSPKKAQPASDAPAGQATNGSSPSSPTAAQELPQQLNGASSSSAQHNGTGRDQQPARWPGSITDGMQTIEDDNGSKKDLFANAFENGTKIADSTLEGGLAHSPTSDIK